MTGMAVNIHLWRHLLYRVEFDCAVDHRAIPYIMKIKTLPATTRIMRLLEILSGYAFNLYFVKGKDMKISDFLSRIDVDRGNPGVILPPIHGAQKHLDPTVKPEHDKPVPVSNQNKQRSPTSADAKPKVLLRPKLPASQIARKRLIDRSIKLFNKPRPQISVPRKTPVVQKQSPMVQRGSPQ